MYLTPTASPIGEVCPPELGTDSDSVEQLLVKRCCRGSFKQDSCTSDGHRQYSSVLYGIPDGMAASLASFLLTYA